MATNQHGSNHQHKRISRDQYSGYGVAAGDNIRTNMMPEGARRGSILPS
jgi:hypothetical protein